MRYFLTFIILISLFCANCHKQYVQLKTPQQYNLPTVQVTAPPPAYGNKIVYVDDTFTPEQETAIFNATLAWENASSGKIKITPYFKNKRPGKIQDFYKTSYKDNSIFIWNISDKDLDDNFMAKFDNFVGYWDTKANILIFTDRIYNNFYNIVLHETGHSLGLVHYNENYLTVMRFAAASVCITEVDAQQLCDIYNCNPQPECETKDYLTSMLP